MSATDKAISTLCGAIVALPRPLLLGLDVDGTLAPIVDDPTRAHVPATVQTALRRLVRDPSLHVAFITGRDRAALATMLRVPGAYRAVEHGRVILEPGRRATSDKPTKTQQAKLDAFTAWARQQVTPRGGELERKPQSRGVHVRRLAQSDPAGAREILQAAEQQAKALGLHARLGRAVLEAELQPGDKGQALRELYKRTRARAVVFAGDDLTDLPALEAAQALGGIGVFVRSAERPRKPRGVGYAVDGPAAIGALLQQLSTTRSP